MAQVRFVLGDPPFAPGDFADLPEAEAFEKFYDGIVEFAEAPPVAQMEVEPEAAGAE